MVGCQTKSRKIRGARGFTLIELLVVIVILGVMSAVVVFAVSNLSTKGDAAACAADSREVTNAEEAYHALNTGYASEADLVANGHLHSSSSLHDVTLTGGTYQVVPVGRCVNSTSVAAPGPGVTVKLLASGGAGMSGAQIEYFNGSAWLPVGTTGTDGAAVAALPAGTYPFQVDYRGQRQLIAATAVTTGSVVEVHTFPVTVVLSGAGGGGGAAIAHLGNDGFWMTDDSTDGSGTAVLELLAGSYTFRADYSGETNIIPGIGVLGATTVSFPLTAVTVNVGEASAGVEHRANNGEWIASGTTNGGGTVTFAALEGDYTVRAHRSNGSIPQAGVSVGGGAVSVNL
jgi:prepilin-type N-terminal cleavage/methylation domain-containing protein